MNYIQKNDLLNFQYLQIPKKIWNMYLKQEIKETSFKIYIEFFDRLKLSSYNNWIDKEGSVYIKYSYDEILELLNVGSRSTISFALKELEELGLILKKKGFNSSSKYYLSNILEMNTNKYKKLEAKEKEVEDDCPSADEDDYIQLEIFKKYNLKESTILNIQKLKIKSDEYSDEEINKFLDYTKKNKLGDGYIYKFFQERKNIKELGIKIVDKDKQAKGIINYWIDFYNITNNYDEAIEGARKELTHKNLDLKYIDDLLEAINQDTKAIIERMEEEI